MASYGQTVTLQFTAFDATNNVPKTGDSANFTLRWTKDGTASAPTNSCAEVDATNAPGEYKIVMTAAEASCYSGKISGKSSTSGVVIIPQAVTFERNVTVDLTQAVPTTNTAETVGDAFNAARAQGFGKWVISGTTLVLYANDGTTPVRSFTISPSLAAASRT